MGLIFLGQILFGTYTICQHDQIFISCTIPSKSPFLPSLVFLLCYFAAFVYYVINYFICHRHFLYFCIFYYHINFEFFPPTLAGSLSLEAE